MDTYTKDILALVQTLLIAAIGGLVGWFAQDMRKRMTNVERRLGHTVRALFYIVTAPDERRRYPIESRKAIEEAMKEVE